MTHPDDDAENEMPDEIPWVEKHRTDEDLWKDPEWLQFYNTRPKPIQELILKRPCNRTYNMIRDDGSISSVQYQIVAYEENEDGSLSLKVFTPGAFGLLPRVVFGIKPEGLIEAKP